MKQNCAAAIPQLVQQQIELYQSLLGLQKNKIELLRDSDRHELEDSSDLEGRAIEDLRQVQQSLRAALGGLTIERHLRQLESRQQAADLRLLVIRLGRLVAEAGAVNLRNFRHVQTTMACNQAILEQGFGFYAGYGNDGGLDSRQSLKQQQYCGAV
ncbi:MAG: flagellar export chaperone FlgN [Acidobacteriota bacterium]